jgi:hypothetical protein
MSKSSTSRLKAAWLEGMSEIDRDFLREAFGQIVGSEAAFCRLINRSDDHPLFSAGLARQLLNCWFAYRSADDLKRGRGRSTFYSFPKRLRDMADEIDRVNRRLLGSPARELEAKADQDIRAMPFPSETEEVRARYLRNVLSIHSLLGSLAPALRAIPDSVLRAAPFLSNAEQARTVKGVLAVYDKAQRFSELPSRLREYAKALRRPEGERRHRDLAADQEVLLIAWVESATGKPRLAEVGLLLEAAYVLAGRTEPRAFDEKSLADRRARYKRSKKAPLNLSESLEAPCLFAQFVVDRWRSRRK